MSAAASPVSLASSAAAAAAAAPSGRACPSPPLAAARSKGRPKGNGRRAVVAADAVPPLPRFRGLGDLSDSEVSLIMHCCDVRSLLRLARCSRLMIRAAGCAFSWRHAEPFRVHSQMPDYLSLQGLGLLEYARTEFQWRRETDAKRFHARIGPLLQAHTQLVALDLAPDTAIEEAHGEGRSPHAPPPIGSEESLMLALGHPAVQSLCSLSLRAAGRYTQMTPTLLRTILAFPALTALALQGYARPLDPYVPNCFTPPPLLRRLSIEDRMDTRSTSMLSYFGGSPLIEDLSVQSPSVFAFDWRPMSERSYAASLKRLVGPSYGWSPNDAFAGILPDRDTAQEWLSKLVALESVRISFVPIDYALPMLAMLPALRRLHVSSSLSAYRFEASIPSIESVALLLSSCPLLRSLSLSVHASSNSSLSKKELKARSEMVRQRFLPLPPELAKRFQCSIVRAPAVAPAARDQ